MGPCNPKTVQAIKKTVKRQHNGPAQRELGLEEPLVGVIRLAVLINIYRLRATTSHIGLHRWPHYLERALPRSDSLRVVTGNKVTQI